MLINPFDALKKRKVNKTAEFLLEALIPSSGLPHQCLYRILPENYFSRAEFIYFQRCSDPLTLAYQLIAYSAYVYKGEKRPLGGELDPHHRDDDLIFSFSIRWLKRFYPQYYTKTICDEIMKEYINAKSIYYHNSVDVYQQRDKMKELIVSTLR